LSVLAGLALSQAPAAFACGHAVPFTDAKEAAAFQPSASVEMKGTLEFRWIYRCGKPTAVVTVNGTTYELTFPADADEARAKKLEGQAVLVKGTLSDRFVTVSSLEALPFDSFQLTQSVKIKGKLHARKEQTGHGGVENGPPGFVTVWEIVIDGQHYQLDLGNDPQFLKMAETFNGKTVVVTGSYQPNYLGLEEKALSRAELIALPIRGVAGFVTVTGMGVEPGDKAYFQETRNVDLIGTIDVPEAVILESVPSGCYALVSVNGQTYWLDLHNRTDLQEKVNQLKGHKAHVKGHLESRRVLLPIIPEARTGLLGSTDVLVVDEIEAAAP
jgi:hypothetical protein